MITIKYNLIVGVLVIIAMHLMNFHQSMSALWIGSYLSAASNITLENLYPYVDFEQIKQFSLLSKELKSSYAFPVGDNLVPFDYMNYGFLFIVVVSKKVFFFLGDIEAIIVLQYMMHLIISFAIFNQFHKVREKGLFFVFYMVNPVILYFVNFPFYYFWQVVPSSLFLFYYLSKKKINNFIFLFTFIFAFIYSVRPTVIFIIILFYFIYGYREKWQKSIVAFITFVVLIVSLPSSGQGPWHTIYIGIGGYSNQYNIELTDTSGYDYFVGLTGKTIGSQFVTNKPLLKEYYKVVKDRYMYILKENPVLLLRNAIYNIASSYSFGYRTGNKILIYLSIISGFIFMGLLLYTKQYILFLAIGFASGSFTPYYPPIGAYMYGSYILIVAGMIEIISFYTRKYL